MRVVKSGLLIPWLMRWERTTSVDQKIPIPRIGLILRKPKLIRFRRRVIT